MPDTAIHQAPSPGSVKPLVSRLAKSLDWRGAARVAGWVAAGVALGGALARRYPAPTAAPVSAARPADKTLAWRSPAVLGNSPHRRFVASGSIDRAATIEDLRAMAHRRLPRFALEYLEAGSEDEASLARNQQALAELRFAHRSLVDVARRDVSSELFGRRMTMPFAVAPTGLNGLFWPRADLHLAQAAASAGIPFAQSTMSNDLMERVALVPGLRYWWQLYVFGPEEIRNSLINRARDAGCEALIITVDAQIYGNREWHDRTMASPSSLSWASKIDTLMHPRWLVSGLATHGMPRFENVMRYAPPGKRGFFETAHWIRTEMDRGLDWETVKRIREKWPRTLMIKGLLTVDDAVRAAEIGADAVVLSNHGGRQLDWSVAPLDVLPMARQAVGNRITLLVDGGMRRGSDIIKAVALGADAVLCGRAVLYGVAAGGRAGAKRALDILREEIDRDLGLLGVRSIADLSPGLLVHTPR